MKEKLKELKKQEELLMQSIVNRLLDICEEINELVRTLSNVGKKE